MPQNSILESGTDIIVGKSNAFRFVFRCFNLSYTHNFYVLRYGENPIFSKEGFTAASSYDFIEGSLSDDDILEIGADFNDAPLAVRLAKLETYDGDTLIGTSSLGLVLQFTSEYTSPVIGDITYYDTNNAVVVVLGSNQFILQGQSNLTLSAPCSGQYGAQITDRQIRTPSKNVSSDTNLIPFGEVLDSGDVRFELTVTDSRGYVSTATKQITVLPYSSVSIDSASVERTSPISTTAHITLSAKRSVVTVNDADKNTNTAVYYRKKATTASIWGDWVIVRGVSDSNGNISVDSSAITGLDAENSYDVEIKVADSWTEAMVAFVVPAGKPALFFSTTGKIGVGTLNPQAALDVDGDIHMNGYPVFGFRATLDDTTNLNDVASQGVYAQPQSDYASTSLNYPAAKAGILEVITEPSGHILQRYTTYDLSGFYGRYRFLGTWGTWMSMGDAKLQPETELVLSDNLFDKSIAITGKIFYHSSSGPSLIDSSNGFYAYVPLRGAGTYTAMLFWADHGESYATRVPILKEDKTFLQNVTGTLTKIDSSFGYIEFTITETMIANGAALYAFDGQTQISPTLDEVMIVKDREYPSAYIPYGYIEVEVARAYSVNILSGKTAVFLGDSICAGTTTLESAAEYGYGWGGLIGEANRMRWKNFGRNGGTIAPISSVEEARWIPTQVDWALAQYPDADYVIFEGGCNDADTLGEGNLGTFSASGYAPTDTSTFTGAFEVLVLKILNSFPNAKIGYIVAQKMGVSDNYGSANNRYRKFFDRAVEICQKWGIPVIDLWNETPLNPKLAIHYDSSLTADQANKNGKCYTDGQHLTLTGYKKLQNPIEEFMRKL